MNISACGPKKTGPHEESSHLYSLGPHIQPSYGEQRFLLLLSCEGKKKKSNFINVNILWTAYHLSCGHRKKQQKTVLQPNCGQILK